MAHTELLTDAFGRVHELVHGVVDGLSANDLAYRADPDANTIAWLVWHLTRIQDDHLAGLTGGEQVWTEDGWAGRFDLPFDISATGYGQDTNDVAAVAPKSGDLLVGYHDDVHVRTIEFISSVSEDDLTSIVDPRWDPPVTLAVRLVSVLSDTLQHAGQAAYVRGLVERRGG